ncbi:hypothetical protein DUI87_31931 [Hirundo rustica rustica]|uniref:Kazrin N-terminal domain-containing protein n=1 Tax=Hirundo rustica rustica TaxID=333673 RepID=A0A3M0IQL7_HIRRU|nr:hypothetical protein DUI87_31931 [Hirundo rustica rustica]
MQSEREESEAGTCRCRQGSAPRPAHCPAARARRAPAADDAPARALCPRSAHAALLREEVAQLQEEVHLLRQMKEMLTKDLEETHGSKSPEVLSSTELKVQLAQKEQELARAKEALQAQSCDSPGIVFGLGKAYRDPQHPQLAAMRGWVAKKWVDRCPGGWMTPKWGLHRVNIPRGCVTWQMVSQRMGVPLDDVLADGCPSHGPSQGSHLHYEDTDLYRKPVVLLQRPT